MTLHAMPVMLGVLAILAIASRFYSAFLAARVAVLDDTRPTSAHQDYDGHNFHPTNKWVLSGHRADCPASGLRGRDRGDRREAVGLGGAAPTAQVGDDAPIQAGLEA